MSYLNVTRAQEMRVRQREIQESKCTCNLRKTHGRHKKGCLLCPLRIGKVRTCYTPNLKLSARLGHIRSKVYCRCGECSRECWRRAYKRQWNAKKRWGTEVPLTPVRMRSTLGPGR